jgi:hypothetical protein
VRAAAKLLGQADVKADDLHDRLADLLADADAAPQLRSAALDALVALQDPRLNGALALAVRDAGLEGNVYSLLARIEKLLGERKVNLSKQRRLAD